MRPLRRRLRNIATPAVDRALMRHSITTLRVSLGLVFLLFGALKLVPGGSPAADVATETMEILTFGVVPGTVALYGVALMECTIGVLLVSGRWPRVGVALLFVALVGVLSPLVLLRDELFTGPAGAPNLLGQYVIKDIVLAASALVVLATVRGGRLRADRRASERSGRERIAIVVTGLDEGRTVADVCAEHGIAEATYVAWLEDVTDGAGRTLAAREHDRAPRVLHRRVAERDAVHAEAA